MARRNGDEELRRRGRRASATGDREDAQAFALAQERSDGAIAALKGELAAMAEHDWRTYIFGNDDVDGLEPVSQESWVSSIVPLALWLANAAVLKEGHYGMLSGEPGEGEGIAEIVHDTDTGQGVFEMLTVNDDQRDMVTIGMRRSMQDFESAIAYRVWPDLVSQVHASGSTGMRAWWDFVARRGGDPIMWREWGRWRYEMSMTDRGVLVYDRVRVPRAVIERWNLLEGQAKT